MKHEILECKGGAKVRMLLYDLGLGWIGVVEHDRPNPLWSLKGNVYRWDVEGIFQYTDKSNTNLEKWDDYDIKPDEWERAAS